MSRHPLTPQTKTASREYEKYEEFLACHKWRRKIMEQPDDPDLPGEIAVKVLCTYVCVFMCDCRNMIIVSDSDGRE